MTDPFASSSTGDAMMLRLKESLLLGGVSEKYWRNFRAKNLAFFVALHRQTRWPVARRVIVEDIVPDIGWPRSKWLKSKARKYLSEIRTSLKQGVE